MKTIAAERDAQALYDYVIRHSSAEDALLYELRRYTHLHTLSPRMLTGHVQGLWLTELVRLHQPKYILEIGTFTGYGTLCMAMGMPIDAQLTSVDPNAETTYIAKSFVNRSPYADRICMVTGDALKVLDQWSGPLDFVYLDAVKKDYLAYYESMVPKMKSGGIILADNTLWSGKILDQKPDKTTKALQEFNSHVANDPRTQVIILPIRDGLSYILVK